MGWRLKSRPTLAGYYTAHPVLPTILEMGLMRGNEHHTGAPVKWGEKLSDVTFALGGRTSGDCAIIQN